MKNSLSNTLHKAAKYLLGLVAIGLINACVEDVLPGAGSKPDEVPPGANFSYASDAEDFKKIIFTNLSQEAISFEWDFGVPGAEVPDSVLTAKDPEFTYPDEDTYSVKLIATDGLGISDTITLEVVVVKGPYLPVILEAGFEDGQLDGGTGDGRDAWRSKTWTADGNSWADENAVFGISASPVTYGSQAAKLEPQPSNPRQGYQEITVDADQNYDLYFWYTMKDGADDPWATVSIVGVTDHGPITSKVEAQAGIIASVTVKDDSEPEVYVQQKLSFYSGTNTTVAIYFWNDGNVETRLDEFSIEIGSAGAVPPSVSFTAEQSAVNYLEYTFVNSSIDAESYQWDLGDGNTSTDASPTHTYAEAGMYTVSLIGTNESGLTADFSTTIDIQDPVTAEFSYAEGADVFTIDFSDESVNAVSVMWDFGDGYSFSTTEKNADITHIYTGGPGFYIVKLTSTSSTGLESEKLETLAIGVPKVLGGDFEDTDTGDDRDYWKPASFSGSETSTTPYGGSSDGAFQTYDGTDTESKTRGAKIDASRCAVDASGNVSTGNTRYAYQEISGLSAGVEYYLEYSYNNSGGTIVAGEILDGHFDDGSNALAASLNGSSLVEIQGTAATGEDIGNSWRTIRGKFTAPASGNVSIWMWAFGGQSYYDNIKILPASIVDTP
ncbi:PKD domain-containing protein [Reichenbachiella carrageenanivorans]|uniref:PKD domain-containing protein n=1 Tax=Reichenbachiella carrageenanivorans TaxID=2979869 RepID=A0ABY6CWL5_9BACT|nr:PKD domain-containing protein [Reichenbachiella carrageenanivorans]UXX78263.1 PKD domain-containing protein [Reichenbachiella carrageenanivorans]